MVLHRGNRVLELTRVLLRKQFTITFKKDKKPSESVTFLPQKARDTHTAGFEQTKASFPTKKET